MRKFLLLTVFSFISFAAFSQFKSITGRITDSDSGEPLTGVTVKVDGTDAGTISDFNGYYTVLVPQSSGVLVFSFVGYKTQKIDIGDQTVINVILDPDQKLLDEVVVVGYGTQIKTQLTGSISSVSGEQIEHVPVTSVEQAMQGKAAGVFIEANNGKVGSDIKIRIRGSSSINASNQPLVVVDGIPINTVAINDYYNLYLNPLNDIDFNNIASIEVLKDASAAAIYGSRGANGVILITTKRGQEGAAKITIDHQQGWSDPTRLREFMNAKEYVSYYTQAAINGGEYDFENGISGYATVEEAIADYLDDVTKKFDRLAGYSDYTIGGINTDWQSLAFQDAQSYQTDVSVSGGTDKMQYYTSFGYSNQDGIMIGNHGDRLSTQTNIDATLTKKINFGLSLALSRYVNNDIPDDNSFSTPLQMVAQAPITPPVDTATGEYYDQPTTLYYNPLIEVDNVDFESTTFRTITNLYAEYKILPTLSLRGEAGGDFTNHMQSRYYGSKSEVGKSVGGYATNYNAGVQNFDTKLLVIFNKDFNAHTFGFTGGTEYQKYDDWWNTVEGQGFPNDKLQTLASAAEITLGSAEINYYRFLSYLGRLEYDYNDTYILDITGRYDGSSRFGENNRYGFFPSVAAGWVMTNEAFMKDSKGISFFKLRASFGVTGNAGIGNFDYKGLYAIGSYNSTPAIYPSTIANPDLTWEKTSQIDAGIDYGFFKDRLNGQIDVYVKNTTDILLDVPVPATTGYATQTQNVGKLENKGFEFVMNYDILVGKLKWTTSLNYAMNRNKVTELSGGQTLIDNGSSDFMNVVMVGQPIGVFYGAEYAGVDPENGDGLYYLNDGSGGTTNDFNLANYVVIGDPNPDFIAGMINNFSFKNLSLDVVLQSVYGNDIHMSGDYWMSSNASQWDNQTVDQLDAWQQPGDETDIPENRLLFENGTQARSSRWLSDGSYLRVKTVTLGYNFSKRFNQRLSLTSSRFYISGYNLATVSKYRGWDPEVSTDSFTDNIYYGIDFYSAPQPRTIVFGISLEL